MMDGGLALLSLNALRCTRAEGMKAPVEPRDTGSLGFFSMHDFRITATKLVISPCPVPCLARVSRQTDQGVPMRTMTALVAGLALAIAVSGCSKPSGGAAAAADAMGAANLNSIQFSGSGTNYA